MESSGKPMNSEPSVASLSMKYACRFRFAWMLALFDAALGESEYCDLMLTSAILSDLVSLSAGAAEQRTHAVTIAVNMAATPKREKRCAVYAHAAPVATEHVLRCHFTVCRKPSSKVTPGSYPKSIRVRWMSAFEN